MCLLEGFQLRMGLVQYFYQAAPLWKVHVDAFSCLLTSVAAPLGADNGYGHLWVSTDHRLYPLTLPLPDGLPVHPLPLSWFPLFVGFVT